MNAVTRIKLGNANAYLVRLAAPGAAAEAPAFVLVDTGLSMSWSRLRAALAAEGCLPGTLRLIVLTHGDLDHTGNCVNLRREYRAPLAMHRLDAPMAEKGLRRKRQARGAMGTVMNSLMRSLSRLNLLPQPELFTPDLLLEDGQKLAEHGWDATVIHVPGHTEGSLAVLAGDGSLFSGDTLFGAKHPSLFIEDAEAFQTSLAKLRALKPATKMVYPGHGDPFPAERMDVMQL